MLDPKKQAVFDQSSAECGETLPQLWSSIYKGLKEKFSERQAWQLLKIVIFAHSGGKVYAQGDMEEE